MATLKLTPEAEMDIVCTKAMLFPATNFTFTNSDTGNPEDMSGYNMKLTMWTQYGGSEVLKWQTSDGSITIGGDDNNVVTLEEKTSVQMAIDAKTYVYDWVVWVGSGDPVRYFTGKVIVKPSGS